MPSTSERQRRAMEAAAAGHSNVGIPKSVGMDFRSADRAKARKRHSKRKGRKGRK